MLDIQLLRSQREAITAALAKRMPVEEFAKLLDAILLLDTQRRELIQEIDAVRAKRNAISREIGAAVRAGKGPGPPIDLPDSTQAEGELREVETRVHDLLLRLPNLPADDVLPGGKEANRVLRVWGTPPLLPNVIAHADLATKLGLVDFARGAKLSGSGFWIYRDIGARLEWALINFFVRENIAAGYTMLLPPHLALPTAGRAAGQFPRFVDDVYHTTDSTSLFLIPTSETAIVGAFAEEIFAESQLPYKVFAYTPCYRSERAGAHSDERGTVRGHQFNKVEIFQFVVPGDATAAFEAMVAHVESLMQKLGLHHRVSLLAAGDASASMRKTIDVEVWMPSIGAFKEVSSISWAGDYQARRAKIRFRTPKGTQLVHTLNGSALATSRVLPALLEQFQQPDGSVEIPTVLHPYLEGLHRIAPASTAKAESPSAQRR